MHEIVKPYFLGKIICIKFQTLQTKQADGFHSLNSLLNMLFIICIHVCLFVCVEVLRPSQPNGVMSSAVSLPNHTLLGRLSPLSG